KIETQKKNKNRLNIFLDDEFAFGLDATVAAKFRIGEGDELTEEQISNLLLTEERKQIKDKAFRYLAGRAHSEKELRTKLNMKGYDNHLTDQVITELKEAKFIDDAEFAVSYARSRLLQNPMGEKLLRHELWQKGVNEELIEQTVLKVYSEESQTDLAKKLFDKRKARYKDLTDPQSRKKMGEFLLRRGFSWEVIKEVLEAGT
nr:hypothetical protein [candidate division KSB1 bacterium]